MRPPVTVVGSGPAGLMAAEILAAAGVGVRLIDHMRAPARKFLVAGRGGLNLTHSEPLDILLTRYGPARGKLEPAIRAFPPDAVMAWCQQLGVATFTGSSGRIFPCTMKASPLLRAWLQRLSNLGVTFLGNTRWHGFDGTPTILALGGASWPQLGSDAKWIPYLRSQGVRVNDFQPSNGRVRVAWSEHFKSRHAGSPLKNIALNCAGVHVQGEIVISHEGLEGGAIYQLSRVLRENPSQNLMLDLKPGLTAATVAQRLCQPRGSASQSNFLRRVLRLSPAAIALLHETRQNVTAELIKSVPLETQGFVGIDRAISSAGGIDLAEVDANFQLLKCPGCYAVGEMLDWDAPTGGYLLQACFSTAVAAAKDMLKSLPH